MTTFTLTISCSATQILELIEMMMSLKHTRKQTRTYDKLPKTLEVEKTLKKIHQKTIKSRSRYITFQSLKQLLSLNDIPTTTYLKAITVDKANLSYHISYGPIV